MESDFKVSVWFIKSGIKACAVKKKRSLPGVNEHFFDKHNEDIGLYGQTLFNETHSGH